jgi:hypothetical protein
MRWLRRRAASITICGATRSQLIHKPRAVPIQLDCIAEPLRNISKRVSISPAGLLRHKSHVGQAIVKAGEKREERLGDNLLDEMRRVQQKAWELLAKTESEGDHRASIVALREVRECLESLGEMLSQAGVEGASTRSQWTNEALRAELHRRDDFTDIRIRFVRPGDKPERDNL